MLHPDPIVRKFARPLGVAVQLGNLGSVRVPTGDPTLGPGAQNDGVRRPELTFRLKSLRPWGRKVQCSGTAQIKRVTPTSTLTGRAGSLQLCLRLLWC